MTKKTTIRVKKTAGQFATIHKGFLDDHRLGAAAMGVLAWILAKPDNWKIHVSHIATSTGSAYNQIRQAIQRLAECGYLRRTRVTDRKTGRVIRWDFTVFETPQLATTAEQEQPLLFEKFDAPKMGRKEGEAEAKPHFQPDTPDVENPGGGLPENGNPHAGNPDGGKQQLLKTNDTKNDFYQQRRTNEQPPAPAPAEPPASDRLPASAGGSGDRVATAKPSASAGAEAGSGDVVVGKNEEIVPSLVKQGCFPLAEAQKLVSQYGEEKCRQGLACLAALQKPPRNRRGLIVKAIQEGWEPGPATDSRPAAAPPAKDPADVQAGRDRAEQQLDARRQQDGALNLLSDADWAEYAQRFLPRLGSTSKQKIAAGVAPRLIGPLRDLVYSEIQRRPWN